MNKYVTNLTLPNGTNVLIKDSECRTNLSNEINRATKKETELKNDIDAVKSIANENSSEITTIHGDITTIHDDITAIENKNTELKNDIDTVKSVANENSAEITTIHGDITTIHDDITAIENKNAEQDNDISTLRTMISSPYNFKGKVASLSALPASGRVNDTYYVQDVKYKVTWDGSKWVQSSLSEADYQTELSELNGDLDDMGKSLALEDSLSIYNLMPYVVGSLNDDGSLSTYEKYRVSSKEFFIADKDLLITPKEGYRFGWTKKEVGDSKGIWYGWYTSSAVIPKGTRFKLQLSTNPEDTSTRANIKTFATAFTVTPYGNDTIVSPFGNYNLVSGTIDQVGNEKVDFQRLRSYDFIPLDNLTEIVRLDKSYKYGVHYYGESKNHLSYTPWLTDMVYKLSKDSSYKYIKIVVSKIDDSDITPTEAENVGAFVNSVKNQVETNTNKLNNLLNVDNGIYKYYGEKIPSKAYGFNAELLLTMSYDESQYTAQDIEVFDDYMFVAFSGVDAIRVYRLSDKSLLGKLNVDTQHGSGMQFSKEYYADGDTFPLLYVGGWTSNLINVVRVKLTNGSFSGTVVKTIKIPTTYGYYASPSIDGANNILYTYAHSNSSIPNSDNMIIASWDLNTLTDNGDNTYTPKLLGQCESPSVGTYQGHKYYGDRIYMTASNTVSPYEPKMYAIDCSTGEIVTTIDIKPIIDSELEGLCYAVNDNQIDWYLSEWNKIFKLYFN